MHGKFNWNELMTDDVEKAKAFYAATVGWTYQKFPMPDAEYWIAHAADGTPAAGIMSMPADDPEAMPGWLCYVEVDNVDERCRGVASAGGEVLQEPFDIPGVGRIAIVSDPAGAIIGWLTPAAAASPAA